MPVRLWSLMMLLSLRLRPVLSVIPLVGLWRLPVRRRLTLRKWIRVSLLQRKALLPVTLLPVALRLAIACMIWSLVRGRLCIRVWRLRLWHRVAVCRAAAHRCAAAATVRAFGEIKQSTVPTFPRSHCALLLNRCRRPSKKRIFCRYRAAPVASQHYFARRHHEAGYRTGYENCRGALGCQPGEVHGDFRCLLADAADLQLQVVSACRHNKSDLDLLGLFRL